jgi:hypothetical protein
VRCSDSEEHGLVCFDEEANLLLEAVAVHSHMIKFLMQSYLFSVYDGKWRTCANSHPHRCHKVFAVQGSGWQLCIQTGEGMFHKFCKYFLESRLSLNLIVNLILLTYFWWFCQVFFVLLPASCRLLLG